MLCRKHEGTKNYLKKTGGPLIIGKNMETKIEPAKWDVRTFPTDAVIWVTSLWRVEVFFQFSCLLPLYKTIQHVVHVIKQSVSPKMFTNQTLFTTVDSPNSKRLNSKQSLISKQNW